MYRKNQISRLGKTSNLEKLVLIESTDQSANCRDCEEDDLQCQDIISGRKLDFPVFKNITPSDQRCYNVNSIKQVVGKVDDSLLRTLPRDPNTTPDDPTFWQLPRDLNPAKAGRFDIDDILTVYRGDSTKDEKSSRVDAGPVNSAVAAVNRPNSTRTSHRNEPSLQSVSVQQ